MTTAERARPPSDVSPPTRRRWAVGPARRRPAVPAARFDAGRVAETRRRNPTWLLAGVLLVVMSALGGVLLFSAQDDRTDVLVAAGDLAAGDIVGRDDLRIERVTVEGGVSVVAPSAVDELVGRRAVGPIPGGTLLNREMFATGSGIGPDEMELGAALDPGEFPRSDIPRGARVELLVTAPAERATQAPPESVPPPTDPAARSIGVGVVTAVEARASGQLLLTVRVQRSIGYVAAQAARADTLRVVLVGDDP